MKPPVRSLRLTQGAIFPRSLFNELASACSTFPRHFHQPATAGDEVRGAQHVRKAAANSAGNRFGLQPAFDLLGGRGFIRRPAATIPLEGEREAM